MATTHAATAPLPQIAHETAHRIRFRWKRLLDPALRPDYLEAWLANLPGVESVRVNPQGRAVIIEYDGTPGHRSQILAGLARIPEETFRSGSPVPARRRLIDVFFHTHLAMLLPLLPPAAQAAIGTAMGAPAVLRGMDTLINEGLKARVLDMTTIGASLLRADFTTAASISAMVVVGEYLRGLSDDKSNTLLKSLITRPAEAVWVERDGQECTIPYEAVRSGDTVLCASGELVPVDGEILDGEAMVDTSSITGESAPMLVRRGDEIISGSVVVEGRLKISVLRAGSETSMARIAEFMTRALNEQSTAELKSNRLADSLTPLTLGLGAALYAATGDMARALSVLTIDFACAVKFPAPLVIKTSMHAASKEGVLIKSGRALETLADVDAIVFDKTGTLTMGRLSVTDILLCPQDTTGTVTHVVTEVSGHETHTGAAAEFLRTAAAVEDRYGHPIGLGILHETQRHNLVPHTATDMDLNVAHGVSGTVMGSKVRVGSRHFIEDDCGIACGMVAAHAAALRAEGKTLVYVSKDAHLLGVAALRDTIRPEAQEIVAALQQTGIRKMVVLTGDHEGTTTTLGATFPGLSDIRAELRPEDKAAVVTRLREEGYTVAVVGDGVNDAPAFTAANVGICMSQSTGLARESAQIVLTHDSLEGLLTARRCALRVSRIMQRCFNTGVGVNVGLLLAAGAGKLTPAVAAAIHNANTFAILGAAAWASSRPVLDQ